MCSYIGRMDIVKKSIIFKAIYNINAIPIKIIMSCFTEKEKNNPKIYMVPQKIPKEPKQFSERKTKPDTSHFMISKYTTWQQYSKQNGTGMKIDTWQMEQTQEHRNKTAYVVS